MVGSSVLDITVLISFPAILLGAISYNQGILYTLEMQRPEIEDQFTYHDSEIFARLLFEPYDLDIMALISISAAWKRLGLCHALLLHKL